MIVKQREKLKSLKLPYINNIVIFLLLIFLFAISACAPSNKSEESQTAKEQQTTEGLHSGERGKALTEPLKPTSPEQKKISPPIRSLIKEMHLRGITRENARERQAITLSNPLVKVDDRGNIQTYIRVRTLDATVIAELKAKQVDIEITNESLNIIQAWVPFDLVEEIAGFEFIELIEPPSYGVPQQKRP